MKIMNYLNKILFNDIYEYFQPTIEEKLTYRTKIISIGISLFFYVVFIGVLSATVIRIDIYSNKEAIKYGK